MLYKYKNDYAKIAMGLLSFIPDLKTLSNLQNELDWYEAQTNRTLFLWKNQYGDFSGIVGIEELDDFVLLRHIAVTPTLRDGTLVYTILDALAQRYPKAKIMGNLDTATLLAKWEKRNDHTRK